jgi:glycosyltransferase involved in cell wall biosynthesis
VRVAAIIPAWNEATTVGAVVDAACRARLIDEVLVVDNGSGDETAVVAAQAGARVVRQPVPGKGQTMTAGVAETDADIVVFLDADLLGLSADHIDELVLPVLTNEADMTCGLFDRGPLSNPVYLRLLPVLTGQRALRRELFEALDPVDVRGYKVEAALNSLVAQHHLRRIDLVSTGLWHRTKEEKFANPVQGFLHKQAMLLTAAWSYLSFVIRRRVVDPIADR